MSQPSSDKPDRPSGTRCLVLGGYGNFGSRISRALADDPAVQLIVGGRSLERARAFCAGLKNPHHAPLPVAIDILRDGWQPALRDLRCDVVIHTCGPFQGQAYDVARVCASSGIHYIDLADGRDFVCGISKLNETARQNGCLIVSGASSVPALSAAVIARLARQLKPVEIQIVIAPGQQTPRGLATLRSVMSYCGQPFNIIDGEDRQTVHGWQGLKKTYFHFLRPRLSAWCDVPDLSLLPETYPSLKRAEFRAALELRTGHFGFWILASLHRAGLVRDPAAWASTFQAIANRLDVLGSDVGGMRITLKGIADDGMPTTRHWELVAYDGHGPQIPAIPAIIIARRLAAGRETRIGAMSGAGLISLDEFDAETSDLNLHWEFF